MKRISVFYALLVILSLSACGSGEEGRVPTTVVNNPNSADGTVAEGSLPVLKFDKTEHDFGQLIQGERVSYAFKFKNEGTSDLVIASANAGCGCTIPNYPRQPIAPGESGVVEVSFNTNGKSGFQNQRVSIVANTQPNTTVITIKANVVIP
ncbi:MAG: DUF1573 domain-containing protein [Bacteroidales bacterium]|nr:DUF1573 domain-containing protein [Bacteroidales bacterium]